MIKIALPVITTGREVKTKHVPDWVWKAAVEFIPDLHPHISPRAVKAVQTKRFRFCEVVLKNLPEEEEK